MYAWTCRAGFEEDLALELGRTVSSSPALLVTEERPASWPVFARAGFEVAATVGLDADEIAGALAEALDAAMAQGARPWILRAWVPDADETNIHSGLAAKLEELVRAKLAALRPDFEAQRVDEAASAVRYGGVLAEICVVSPERALVGVIAAQDAPTLAAGGRARSRMPKDAPSRAARKLVEAFEWTGFGPGPGEKCVDLGAAPGGWTAVLLERKARVIAVDPANLAPAIRANRAVEHVQASAFDYLPKEPVDWLLCDMAWRPLEVAALLAKWGRRRLAGALVANVKLPMKERTTFVRRVSAIVEEGGWNGLKARQLYHDREEFTLAAWR